MKQRRQRVQPKFSKENKSKQSPKNDSHGLPQSDASSILDILKRQSITDLSHTDVMTLQRTLGNQQVLNLLRRQGHPNNELAPVHTLDGQGFDIAREPTSESDVTSPLLTPPQVSKAISYHMNQPWRYTPEIIMQIQTEVGTVPTGRMTAIDVQAVAKRQHEMNVAGETPLLKVDGMAGPRTLPSIFKFGLSTDDSIAEYSGNAKEILANQGDKTDEEVAIELCAEANKRLSAQNIPTLEIETKEPVGGRGVFRAREWKLLLHPIQFTDSDKKDMKETTSTIYHEARHAEQAYKIAQMLAGKKWTVAQIVAQTDIREDIVEIAAREENHIQPGTMEAVIVEGWYDSGYSDKGKANIIKNNAEMDKAFAEREAAKAAYEANPTPENEAKLEAAKAAYQKTIDEHHDMPHEFDAERVEDKVEKQLGD